MLREKTTLKECKKSKVLEWGKIRLKCAKVCVGKRMIMNHRALSFLPSPYWLCHNQTNFLFLETSVMKLVFSTLITDQLFRS